MQDPPNPKAWEDLDKGLEGTLSAAELQEVEESLVEKAGKRRRKGGEDGGQSQTQSLDFGSQSMGSQSLDCQSQSIDPDLGAAVSGSGFGWSLFGGVRAVCIADEDSGAALFLSSLPLMSL